MVVQNVSTTLKDIKVTKKGINITLEDARLEGEQLQQLASLIGDAILVAVSTPQISLFEDNEETHIEAEEETICAEAEVEQELGLS